MTLLPVASRTLPEFPWLWSQVTTVPWVCGAGGMRLPLPRLWRHPFHSSPERKPSGIPVAVVCDHGAVVSTGFPSPDAGWVPAVTATRASGACHLLRVNGGASMGRTKRGITSFTCVRAAESVRRPGLARFLRESPRSPPPQLCFTHTISGRAFTLMREAGQYPLYRGCFGLLTGCDWTGPGQAKITLAIVFLSNIQ